LGQQEIVKANSEKLKSASQKDFIILSPLSSSPLPIETETELDSPFHSPFQDLLANREKIKLLPAGCVAASKRAARDSQSIQRMPGIRMEPPEARNSAWIAALDQDLHLVLVPPVKMKDVSLEPV
jgi:hypothetical protein